MENRIDNAPVLHRVDFEEDRKREAAHKCSTVRFMNHGMDQRIPLNGQKHGFHTTQELGSKAEGPFLVPSKGRRHVRPGIRDQDRGTGHSFGNMEFLT